MPTDEDEDDDVAGGVVVVGLVGVGVAVGLVVVLVLVGAGGLALVLLDETGAEAEPVAEAGCTLGASEEGAGALGSVALDVGAPDAVVLSRSGRCESRFTAPAAAERADNAAAAAATPEELESRDAASVLLRSASWCR